MGFLPHKCPWSREKKKRPGVYDGDQDHPTAARAASPGNKRIPPSGLAARSCPRQRLEHWDELWITDCRLSRAWDAPDVAYACAHCARGQHRPSPDTGGRPGGTRTGNLGPSGLGQNPEPGCPGGGTGTSAVAESIHRSQEETGCGSPRGVVVRSRMLPPDGCIRPNLAACLCI